MNGSSAQSEKIASTRSASASLLLVDTCQLRFVNVWILNGEKVNHHRLQAKPLVRPRSSITTHVVDTFSPLAASFTVVPPAAPRNGQLIDIAAR
jgi:hypothetical protein